MIQYFQNIFWEVMLMKSRFFIITLLLALCLSGCGSSPSTSSGSSTVNDTSVVEDSTEPVEVKDLADEMGVQEYSCVVDDSFMYYVMYITNNSDKVVSAEMNVTALDSNGSMVGSSSDGVKAIAPGQTSGIWTTFDEWDSIQSFEYTLTVSEETSYSPVYDDLTVDYDTNDDGIVAKITNNGTDPAEFVWMDVVYIKDGKMVNFSELSFMDDDSQLLPGVTLSADGTCYYDGGFDDVVIAVNGRR
jgi:hypothetical protein